MRPQDIQHFYKEALHEAKQGLAEGGIPIGSLLVHDGKILGRGHNRRIQESSVILHGEMDAFENAGRIHPAVYATSTLFTTLSPCAMCSGAALLYKIPRIVIGENKNFKGEEELLRARGVELIILQDEETIYLMNEFIKNNLHLWHEDIGKNSVKITAASES